MANKIVKTIAVVFAAVAAVGATVGGYYGLKDKINANYAAIPVPDELKAIFADYKSATPLDDTDSQYILSAYEVSLNSGSTGYYYELESASGFSGTLKFAIGVEGGVVSGYQFLENVNENSLGEGNASDNQKAGEAFIGYPDSADGIMAGTTVTSNAMIKAIDAALDDANAR